MNDATVDGAMLTHEQTKFPYCGTKAAEDQEASTDVNKQFKQQIYFQMSQPSDAETPDGKLSAFL